ncbi:MAG: cobalamin-dependent protein [Thermoplasmata archaeon]|nr:cobalamin-dependent protein [Thermoplasmata archaeon]
MEAKKRQAERSADGMNILLVEPSFPIPAKSKNHKDFFPVGLLKIGAYLRAEGNRVKLVRGAPVRIDDMAELMEFKPEEIWVTSLFTYWSEYVRRAVEHYRQMFPTAKLVVGGIFASLLPKDEVMEITGCDEVHQGVLPEAEEHLPALDLLGSENPNPIDYQIVHASRGCTRMCPFCGVWRIEPDFLPEKSIVDKIECGKVVFYDNNLLMNPHIEGILEELIELRREKKLVWCESQSGLDGRILIEKPHLARMIKQAGFRYPRIAWDWEYKEYPQIEEQIGLLKDATYRSKEIFVFMLYNWDIPFDEMEKKRMKCWEWKTQIADCRYRPLDQLHDNYNPHRRGQTSEDYYISDCWTDALVKQFRRNVREQNICVRHGFPFYSRLFESKKVGKTIMRKVRSAQDTSEKMELLDRIGADYWVPEEIRPPREHPISPQRTRSYAEKGTIDIGIWT